MKKEIWVDCTKQNLEDRAIEYNATGIKGKSKRRIRTLPEDSIEVEIKSREDINEVYRHINRVPYIIVNPQNQKFIPTENIAQKAQGTNTKVIARAKTLDEAKTYLGVLESGLDGVLVDNAKLAKDLSLYYLSVELPLVEAEITKVRAARMGTRGTFDLTDIQKRGEALAIGNSISFMYMVGFETEDNPYIDKRDFRCTGAAVSMRFLKDVGVTPYIRDATGGDEVLVINRDGQTRVCDVGGVLIERRPLIYIEAEYKGRIGKIYLQNAETVNLISPDGKITMDKICNGDNILAYIPPIKEYEGRHLGKITREFFLEK